MPVDFSERMYAFVTEKEWLPVLSVLKDLFHFFFLGVCESVHFTADSFSLAKCVRPYSYSEILRKNSRFFCLIFLVHLRSFGEEARMMGHKKKTRAKEEIFLPGQSRKAGGDYGEEY